MIRDLQVNIVFDFYPSGVALLLSVYAQGEEGKVHIASVFLKGDGEH